MQICTLFFSSLVGQPGCSISITLPSSSPQPAALSCGVPEVPRHPQPHGHPPAGQEKRVPPAQLLVPTFCREKTKETSIPEAAEKGWDEGQDGCGQGVTRGLQ